MPVLPFVDLGECIPAIGTHIVLILLECMIDRINGFRRFFVQERVMSEKCADICVSCNLEGCAVKSAGFFI